MAAGHGVEAVHITADWEGGRSFESRSLHLLPLIVALSGSVLFPFPVLVTMATEAGNQIRENGFVCAHRFRGRCPRWRRKHSDSHNPVIAIGTRSTAWLKSLQIRKMSNSCAHAHTHAQNLKRKKAESRLLGQAWAT